MTLDEAKASVRKMSMFGEYQFIVGTPEDCHIVSLYGGPGGNEFGKVNGETVLSYRAWSPTDYKTDQQGVWHDYS